MIEPSPAAGSDPREWNTGRLFLWPGRAIYLGQLLENDAHAHHAVQVSIALGPTLSMKTAPRGRWSSYRAVATAPDQLHRIRCRGPVAQVYLDPEGISGLALREHIGRAGVASIELGDFEAGRAMLRAALDGDGDTEKLGQFIDQLTPTAAAALLDPRVVDALTVMHASSGHHLALGAIARQVAASPSHLEALFRSNVGIPVRRYLLWLRLIDAIAALSDGMSLTEAAYEAGFSDSAHLSRTFRRMFGMAPSALSAQRVEIRRVTP